MYYVDYLLKDDRPSLGHNRRTVVVSV